MLLQVYNDDYVVKRRDVEHGMLEAPLHFIMAFSSVHSEMNPLTKQVSQTPILQMIPLVEWEGKIVPWQDGVIHVKPRKKVQA
jgi:hypothetical protein